MRAVRQRHLGAGDRPDAEVLRGVGELERAVDAVVVGERERGIPEFGGADGELLRQRRTVEEGVRRVRMQLDVWNGLATCGAGSKRLPLSGSVRKLRLKLDANMRGVLQLNRHTRPQWTVSCSSLAKASRSSTAGS